MSVVTYAGDDAGVAMDNGELACSVWYKDSAPRIAKPIYEIDFEGGTSDCTNAGHCTGGACATGGSVDTFVTILALVRKESGTRAALAATAMRRARSR